MIGKKATKDKSKYAYEISNSITKEKCPCGLHSAKINHFEDGTAIAMHITVKSTYWHICVPGSKPKRVFIQPEGFTCF